MNRVMRGLAACAAVLASAAPVAALAQTTPTQMAGTQTAGAAPAWQAYFRAHSLEFPQVFRARHPGPGWILQHAAALHLTAAQVSAETRLKAGMVGAARSAVSGLQAASARYQADAAMTAPSLRVITADIEAVGRAQTRVGLAMVPYHLKAYAVLTPAQKATFQALVKTPAA
jgi:Spy/CpxP family protein refolding chaperone